MTHEQKLEYAHKLIAFEIERIKGKQTMLDILRRTPEEEYTDDHRQALEMLMVP